MARVKPKRHPVVVDMTAMCDVAFLLLTFFILTTQFRKPDVEKISPPSSISEKLLPDGNIMTIDVTQDGRFYFTPVENKAERVTLLQNMAKKHGISVDKQQELAFANAQAIGVPMNKLNGFLKLSEDQRKTAKVEGIPLDSANKQLIDWVEQSLLINPEYKLAIKGDATTNYPKVRDLFEGLRDIKFYKFWLITNQEVGPNAK